MVISIGMAPSLVVKFHRGTLHEIVRKGGAEIIMTIEIVETT
jgi:hypothetical protein